MDITVTRKTTNFKDGNVSDDTIERLLSSIEIKRKKHYFIYDGIKFISDKEIIGVEPNTYKLIYKNNN